jgi:hypothetical protein
MRLMFWNRYKQTGSSKAELSMRSLDGLKPEGEFRLPEGMFRLFFEEIGVCSLVT